MFKDAAIGLSRNVTVRLGNMEENNFGLDRIVKENALPVLFIIPFEVGDTNSETGALNTSIPFNAFMLDKQYNKTTSDYDSEEVELEIIEAMRLLARNYLYKLNQNTAVRDKDGNGIKQVTYTPTYALFDDHVHGVAIRCTIPVVEGLTGCH